MTEQELRDSLKEIGDGHRLIDTMLTPDFFGEGADTVIIRGRQVELVRKIFELFRALKWQLALNGYKTLAYGDDPPIDQRGCGTAVRIRPAGDSKTYFGILLGEVPLSLGAKIEGETLTVMRSVYNPAIYVPELRRVVFGVESWWGEIEDPGDLADITDASIDNQWYVAMMKEMAAARRHNGEVSPNKED